jgi:hypothetical protein
MKSNNTTYYLQGKIALSFDSSALSFEKTLCIFNYQMLCIWSKFCIQLDDGLHQLLEDNELLITLALLRRC